MQEMESMLGATQGGLAALDTGVGVAVVQDIELSRYPSLYQ